MKVYKGLIESFMDFGRLQETTQANRENISLISLSLSLSLTLSLSLSVPLYLSLSLCLTLTLTQLVVFHKKHPGQWYFTVSLLLCLFSSLPTCSPSHTRNPSVSTRSPC